MEIIGKLSLLNPHGKVMQRQRRTILRNTEQQHGGLATRVTATLGAGKRSDYRLVLLRGGDSDALAWPAKGKRFALLKRTVDVQPS